MNYRLSRLESKRNIRANNLREIVAKASEKKIQQDEAFRNWFENGWINPLGEAIKKAIPVPLDKIDWGTSWRGYGQLYGTVYGNIRQPNLTGYFRWDLTIKTPGKFKRLMYQDGIGGKQQGTAKKEITFYVPKKSIDESKLDEIAKNTFFNVENLPNSNQVVFTLNATNPLPKEDLKGWQHEITLAAWIFQDFFKHLSQMSGATPPRPGKDNVVPFRGK